MADEIIKMVPLPSGCTAIALETSAGTLGLEIGSGCIFLETDDLYPCCKIYLIFSNVISMIELSPLW